eukprot:scaffold1916_cov85-Skeletonema_dohrnii-CCMP3373.AAC.3
MANYNGSLQAVDCSFTAWNTIWPSTEEVSAVSDASSGHLRRCNDANMSNKCLSRAKDGSILSWPTIMGHYKLWIASFTAWKRYGRQQRRCRPTQMAHQVTYDDVTTPAASDLPPFALNSSSCV